MCYSTGNETWAWEITSVMKMQDMQMPGNKFKYCLTAQDVASGKQYSGDQ